MNFKNQAKKLKKILVHKRPLSFYKKDDDYPLLKRTVTNRKQILSIMELNQDKNIDTISRMLQIQNDVLDKSENKNGLIIPRQYVRMNTLVEDKWKTTKKSSQEKDAEIEEKNSGDENDFLTADQRNLIKNHSLKPTILPFVYEVPFNKKLKLSEKRFYIIQNLPTTLPPILLNPKENSTVIDACSAPGNKTSHLAAIMKNTGEIIAFEKDKERCKLLKSNLKACNVQNALVRNEDFCETEIKAEYILVDPSCSGSGIHPNYVKDEKRVDSLANFQKVILNKALKIETAKRVVYSTCSIHEEENEMVVQEILTENKKKWEIEKIDIEIGEKGIKTYDFWDKVVKFERGETIGFFSAVFRRK